MEEQDRKPYLWRLKGMSIVVVLVFSILGLNLWRLQIANASYYATKAQGNVMQKVSIQPTRGDIVDRKGELLVTSVPEFALTIDWMDLQQAKNENWKEVVYRLAGYLKPYWPNSAQTVDSITEDILVMTQNHQWERYRPVTVLEEADFADENGNVDQQKINKLKAVIAEHQEELPGVTINILPARDYPRSTLAGQVIGYVREVGSEEEIAQLNKQGKAQEEEFTYATGDIVGKLGIEKGYDYWLRGRDGVQVVEVDSNNRPIAKNVVEPAEPGKTLQLTIDAKLQETVEKSLDEVLAETVKTYPEANGGAAVIIDVKTGKILAMASRPSMNPNDLTGVISDATADKYFNNEDAASYNRALTGTYPPGSTYKMITAMTSLQLGVVNPYEIVNTRSSDVFIEEWNSGEGFGNVNLYSAMANSSNVYFQTVGKRVFDKNPEYMKQISNEFGLGVYSGIDIPGESKGIAPSPEWRKQKLPGIEKQREQKLTSIEEEYSNKVAKATDDAAKKDLGKQKKVEIQNANKYYDDYIFNYIDWHLFNTYNVSIGQGDNLYTPLQLANFVATIVNGGKRMAPYVVDKILDPLTGEVVQENKPKVVNNVSISPGNLEEVKKAMSHVTSGSGTAAWLFASVPEYSGGGKTGTAQIGAKGTAAGDDFNGVYVAFAPYDNPQIAFAGVVEYGGHGGETAGKVARDAFMQYFGWKYSWER